MHESRPRPLAILGSTGSIGTQALDVVAAHPHRFRVCLLSAQRNWQLLAEQARRFRPAVVVIGDETCAASLRTALADLPIAVPAGESALADAVAAPDIELVLTALVGFAGLRPTVAAIEAGKDIALANKETLVVAGELIMPLAQRHGVRILPVDSEHSAIFQCLVGEPDGSIEKLVLTASGGPFRGYTAEQLRSVTRAQALKHPNWSMGAKITIDSASMMNKGLEVIEARWLFGIPPEQIDIIVHPQSIVHSLVQFRDGSIKAQLGLPDMRLPIQYALTYPDRPQNNFPRFDFAAYPNLSFEPVDRNVFRSVAYAYEALARSGNLPCIVNAANEVAVAAFLEDRFAFVTIYDCIERAMQRVPYVVTPTLDDLFATDRETRAFVAAEHRLAAGPVRAESH